MCFFYFKCRSSIGPKLVSTDNKRQLNRRLLSQLDDFLLDISAGSAASNRQQNVVFNVNTGDPDFTVGIAGNILATNENLVKVKTLEGVSFNEIIDKKIGKIVDNVKDKIQKAF